MNALKLAYDRSVRTTDANGFLHVAISNISKATVNPYRGAEIPDQDGVTLLPDKIYNLLRDPLELEKAASTFNNIPLLDRHIPISADEPQKEFIIGSTGTDAVFEAPYLRNSLVVHDQNGIDLIESDQQKELSSAYRYEVDWTPGSYEGLPYDGIMRNIRGNHVAIVESGRAGPDVVVGDSKLEKFTVKTALKSKTALMVAGALMAYMVPKMAADAKLDLQPVLKDVTKDNLKTRKADIGKAVVKMAKDADLEQVLGLIDAVSQIEEEGDDKVNEEAPAVDAEDDLGAKIMAFLKGKVSEEDMASLATMCGGASDADPEGGKGPLAVEGDPKDKPMDKPAMDAAIKRASDATRAETIAHMNAIRTAEDICAPIIGKVKVAQDSAAAVYRLALDAKGISHKDVHESALRPMVELSLQNDGGAAKPKLAADALGAGTWFDEAFPNASKLIA